MNEQEERPDAQAYATNTNANPAMGMYWGPMQSGTYHVTLCNPGGPMLSAGYQQPVYQPSNTFPTPESLRAFVEQCTAKYLDEQIDARVGKALDELAAEMRENTALQPGTWRKGVE